ncbi:MAG: WD40 repeat domain-containing protein [Thermogutta sp.]
MDWSRVPTLAIPEDDGVWEYRPGAPVPAVAERTVPLPPKRDFFEKINGSAINSAAMQGVVSYVLDRPGEGDSDSRLVTWDMRAGHVLGTFSRPGKWAVLALDDEGGKVLVRSDEFGFGKQNLLELWVLRDGECVPIASWRPHPEAWAGNGDLKWAAFLDAETFATCSGGGNLVLWNAADCRPLVQVTIQSGCIPALSEDRAWLAFAVGDRLCLLDTAQREITAARSFPRKPDAPFFAFDASGRKLACADRSGVMIWDLTDGRVEAEFAPAGIPVGGPIAMPDEDFVLLHRRTLVSVRTQVNVWEYTGTEAAETLGGVTFLITGGMNGPGVVVAAKLPHESARQALEKALTQPDLFVFRKGVSVRLDVSAIPPAEQARVRDALTKKLAAQDIRVVPDAPVTVAAGVDPPKHKEVSYHMHGDYKVTEHAAWVRIRYESQDLWQSRGTNIPLFVILKKGENLEGVLRERSKRPDYSFFENVTLPQYLQKPQGNAPGRPTAIRTLGVSQIAAGGNL